MVWSDSRRNQRAIQLAKNKAASRAERERRRALRDKAGLIYATDPEGITLAQLHERPEFQEIPLPTFERWCADDGWVSARAKAWESYRKMTIQRVGAELARERVAMLDDLVTLRGEMIQKLTGDKAVAMRSMEGGVKALLELCEKLQEWGADLIAEALPPGARGGGGGRKDEGGGEQPKLPGSADVQFRPDEVQEMRKAILRKRREEMRAEAEKLKGEEQTGESQD